MAVGDRPWQDLPVINGVKLGVAEAGIKYQGRTDLGVMVFDEGSTVAGVFTQNTYAAAPVHICREHLRSGKIRALVVNSGNANACTGAEGESAAQRSCEAAASHLKLQAQQVLPFSTGVIGEVLPAEKIEVALPSAIENATENAWEDFARAIMTTDTRAKGASKTIEIDGQKISISGVCKGSGMINPNMATMLAYVATDANIAQDLLEDIGKQAAVKSFNRITIDGDTSTNDSCILIATGKSSAPALLSENDAHYEKIVAAIVEVHQELAKQIVEDGEGATKFVEVNVCGGKNAHDCNQVAYAVAHSPLVKTALFASDPNWGRIVCAIGYADVDGLDASKIKVWLDDVLIVEEGGRAAAYTEEAGQAVFNRESFTIKIDLGAGQAEECLWTTDLSHEYIKINAEYRS